MKHVINKVYEKFYLTIHRTFRMPVLAADRRRVFLFGTVEYTNYGDQAITVAELRFFKEFFPKYQIISIPDRLILDAIPKVTKVCRNEDIIAFQGGGNMGDIWPSIEVSRQEVYSAFSTKKIISMPQSTSFVDGSDRLEKTVSILRKCTDITVFAREEVSFNFMKVNFPANVVVKLVPDIVLTMGNQSRHLNRAGITAFLRRDKERQSNPRVVRLITELSKNYSLTVSDTIDSERSFISEKQRGLLLEKKFDQFRSSQLIVTDRLHGAIFATITGTPALVFDNNNHKIRNSFNSWLNKVSYVQFAENLSQDDISKFIQHALINRPVLIPSFESEFATLITSFS